MGNQKITKNLLPDYKGDAVYTVKEDGVKKGEVRKNLFPDYKGDAVYTFHEEPDLSVNSWDSQSSYSDKPQSLGIGGTIFAMFVFGGICSIVGGFIGIFLTPNEILSNWINYPTITPIGYGFWLGGVIGAIVALILGVSSVEKKHQ